MHIRVKNATLLSLLDMVTLFGPGSWDCLLWMPPTHAQRALCVPVLLEPKAKFIFRNSLLQNRLSQCTFLLSLTDHLEDTACTLPAPPKDLLLGLCSSGLGALFPSHPKTKLTCHLLSFVEDTLWSLQISWAGGLPLFSKPRLKGLGGTTVSPSFTCLFGETPRKGTHLSQVELSSHNSLHFILVWALGWPHSWSALWGRSSSDSPEAGLKAPFLCGWLFSLEWAPFWCFTTSSHRNLVACVQGNGLCRVS